MSFILLDTITSVLQILMGQTGSGKEASYWEQIYPLIRMGVLFAVAGYITSMLHNKFQDLISYLKQRVLTTLTISVDNSLFPILIEWLTKHPDLRKTNNYLLLSRFVSKNDYYTNTDDESTVSIKKPLLNDNLRRNKQGEMARLYFSIGYGQHTFQYQNTNVWLDYKQENSNNKVSVRIGRYSESIKRETLTFEVYGKKKTFFRDLILEVVNLKKLIEKQATTIYVMDQWAESWDKDTSNTKPIKMDFVILPEGNSDGIVDDCKKFLKRQKVYERLGIPFRRGYLFYGPPGCGKTTTVRALAGELNIPICIMSLSNGELNDDGLLNLINKAPRPCIMLLEDVDSCFVQREASEKKDQNRVSFSGLLNCLDGIGSQEGRLFFLTTNHIDRLSPALIRPGRVDQKIFFPLAQKPQTERLFLKFYKNETKLAKQFAELIPEEEISIAMIQQHFLRYLQKPKECIENYQELLNELKEVKKLEQLAKEEEERKKKEQEEKKKKEDEEKKKKEEEEKKKKKGEEEKKKKEDEEEKKKKEGEGKKKKEEEEKKKVEIQNNNDENLNANFQKEKEKNN
ncbi:putative atpase [Anaeramoeba flamelloides]|uniref:Atpase n=1 Tax=Anaeramoeba flamelloides TaxID=1746091 RepID=A0AAV7Z7A7_9EUKA|nr:putative atpase [Anaeramoeba flamelloides]